MIAGISFLQPVQPGYDRDSPGMVPKIIKPLREKITAV